MNHPLGHDEYKEALLALKPRMEECCPRHKAIRNVAKDDTHFVNRVLIYFYGPKSCFWRHTPGRKGFMDVEFVPTTKVFPPPKKPWEWCGKTILFGDWHDREKNNQKLRASFGYGDQVTFVHKNKTYRGIVAGVNKRVTVISGNEKWYIPVSQLTKVGGAACL